MVVVEKFNWYALDYIPVALIYFNLNRIELQKKKKKKQKEKMKNKTKSI